MFCTQEREDVQNSKHSLYSGAPPHELRHLFFWSKSHTVVNDFAAMTVGVMFISTSFPLFFWRST